MIAFHFLFLFYKKEDSKEEVPEGHKTGVSILKGHNYPFKRDFDINIYRLVPLKFLTK